MADRKPIMMIVGLGNPGVEYGRTRHNAGFMVVDLLAERTGAEFARHPKYWFAETSLSGRSVVMAKPRTFMNRSGSALVSLLSRFHVDPIQILVVHDDLDLPFGTLKLKTGGGHGGHKGLVSIIQAVGNDFNRLRFGIGHPGSKDLVTDYVLSPFDPEALQVLPSLLLRAVQAVETAVADGMSTAMNFVNRHGAGNE